MTMGGRHLVDSGPLFHGFSTLWEGGIRVPLILRWPNKVKKGVKFSNPTISMDITATMLDAADRDEAISSLDGASLINIMQAPNEYADRTLFWQHGKMKAARQGGWKYMVDGHTQLLFDLNQDVGERHDLFYRQPEKVESLRAAITKWELSVGH